LDDLEDLEDMGAGDQSMPPQMSGNPENWQNNPKLMNKNRQDPRNQQNDSDEEEDRRI